MRHQGIAATTIAMEAQLRDGEEDVSIVKELNVDQKLQADLLPEG